MIVDGELSGIIKKGDSIWCIDTDNKGKKVVQVNLTKKKEIFWSCAIVGDVEVDRDQIHQEINTASDMDQLDTDTRSFVE